MENPVEEGPTRKDNSCCWNYRQFHRNHWRGFLSIIIPIALIPLLAFGKPYRCLYLMLLMSLYWVLDIIPFAVTAMFPIFALPLLKIEASKVVGTYYFSNVTVLVVLSIIVAISFEQSNLHKRIALGILRVFGFRPKVLHLLICLCTMFVSIFITNIATAAIMFPIVRGILLQFEQHDIMELTTELEGNEEPGEEGPSREAMAYYFGLAYLANIGGTATLDGSGISLSFQHMYENFFPNSEISWVKYFGCCLPFAIINGLVVIFYLQFVLLGLFRGKEFKDVEGRQSVIFTSEFEKLGKITYHEVCVILGFISLILLFFFREPPGFDGYASKLMHNHLMLDSAPVALVVIFYFILPSTLNFFRYCCKTDHPLPKGETPSIVTWAFVVNRIPWGLVFLIGSGFAINHGMLKSGLADLIINKLYNMRDWPYEATVVIVIFGTAVLTQILVSVACVTTVMAFLLPLSALFNMHPLRLCIPANVIATSAYLLPVSGATLAMVTALARIKPRDIFAMGCFPLSLSMLLAYIQAVGWIPIVYPELLHFPYGIKADISQISMINVDNSVLQLLNKTRTTVSPFYHN